MIRILVVFILCWIDLANSKTVENVKSNQITKNANSASWTLTASQFKEVKVNGLSLKKSNFWEYDSINQVETNQSEALIFLANQVYLKLFPNSIVKSSGQTLQLVQGQVYIKNLSNEWIFQIPIFFKFKF